MNKKLEKKLYDIAAKHSYAVEHRGDLKSRHNDGDDYLDMSVWGIEKMLKEAYELGKSDGKNEK
ncbi:TPA: hypothetical protein VHV97_000635 [Streptococcus pyogenes]|uniref:DUF6900 domain-containing protein n=1 Tax=Streptococcus hepaticus TaxID=3349163 RepID=UPI002B375979|nr:hypothetical protein [Streptococcus pyogenes]